MRVLAALVAIRAAGLIGMAALGQFAPAPSPVVRSTTRPTSSATAAATARPSGPRTITVTLTEQELTKAAQSYTPLTVSGITVTDPTIKLEPGRLTLTATGRAFILARPIVLVASPLVSAGKAAAKIEPATFAGLELLDSTKHERADTVPCDVALNSPS